MAGLFSCCRRPGEQDYGLQLVLSLSLSLSLSLFLSLLKIFVILIIEKHNSFSCSSCPWFSFS
ncbi:MAG: hypothetical protein N7Q72_06925, partial [Spiroplasma sp. Tabriz.8]|nr:hypothetical protein [Spiroplasma sp. Tabriz.8]